MSELPLLMVHREQRFFFLFYLTIQFKSGFFRNGERSCIPRSCFPHDGSQGI
jgi:hypothetical protein